MVKTNFRPKIAILLLLFINFSINQLSYSAITAQIQNYQSDSISSDDIIELVISTDAQSNHQQIDVTSLQKDFNILSQAKQVSHSIINGVTSSKMQWILSIQAKTVGTFTIPAFRLGNQSSDPITLNIKKPSEDPKKSSGIFMNLEADNQSIYIQSPLTISVNIYIPADITARNLELNSPDQEDYNLFKLSENNKQVFYNNKRYNLFQVKYLGFYNKAGKFNLPTFNLTGIQLKDTSQHHDIFSLYEQQWKPFNRSNPPLPITVLPKPASFNHQNWLTSDKITVDQTWSTAKNIIPVGEAVVQTITINAKNTPADQLPILYNQTTAVNNKNYKIYIDKPEIKNNLQSDKISSTLTQKITYITTQAGTLNIPEQKIVWWNNKAKTQEQTVVPSKSFTIESTTTAITANLADNNKQEPDLKIQNPSTNISPSVNQDSLSPNQLNQNKLNQSLLIYILIFIIALLIIIIFSILAYFVKNKKQTIIIKNPDKTSNNKNIKIALNNLKNLAKNKNAGDAEAVYKKLAELAGFIYPESTSPLAHLKQQLPSDYVNNINSLAQALYSNHIAENTLWDNKFFIVSVLPFVENIYYRQTNNDKKLNTLSGLYPE